MEVERGLGAAKRRRECRLRSMCRHKQLSFKMALACAVRLSAQRGGLDAAVQVLENVAAEYAAPALAVYAAPAPVYDTPVPVAAYNAPALAVYTTSAPAVHQHP